MKQILSTPLCYCELWGGRILRRCGDLIFFDFIV
jgi:hypothetical protein